LLLLHSRGECDSGGGRVAGVKERQARLCTGKSRKTSTMRMNLSS
jgi:hypothetical protein